jgi:hypothetical protein
MQLVALQLYTRGGKHRVMAAASARAELPVPVDDPKGLSVPPEARRGIPQEVQISKVVVAASPERVAPHQTATLVVCCLSQIVFLGTSSAVPDVPHRNVRCKPRCSCALCACLAERSRAAQLAGRGAVQWGAGAVRLWRGHSAPDPALGHRPGQVRSPGPVCDVCIRPRAARST